MSTPKLTSAAIEKTLRRTFGNVSAAAKSLGAARSTITRAIARDKKLRDARDSIREESVDLAESKLVAAIKKGNIKACIFYLKTQGRSRGYGTVLEVSDTNGSAAVRFYMPKKDELPTDEPVAELDERTTGASNMGATVQ